MRPRARRLREARRSRWPLALVGPALGWSAVFFGVPLVMLLAYSLGQIDIITFNVQWGWTLHNYGRVFEALYLNAIGRSLLLSAAATIVCLLVGFPVAHYIALARGRRQLVLLLAVMVPFWTSFLVRTYAMTNVLADGGPIATVYGWLGGGSLGLLYSPAAVLVGIVYSYLPLMILPLYAALERIDPRLREAAFDLGANSRRALLRVTVPLATPGIVAGCILVGVPSTGEYVIPQILGGGKVLMYGNVVADQFQNTGEYPFGAALSVSLMAVLTVVVLVARRGAARRQVAM